MEQLGLSRSVQLTPTRTCLKCTHSLVLQDTVLTWVNSEDNTKLALSLPCGNLDSFDSAEKALPRKPWVK